MAHALQLPRPVTTPTVYRPGVKTAIVKLGPPGCGKGTQTEFFRSVLEIPTLEMGPLLKSVLRGDPAFATGKMIGDDTVRYHMKRWIYGNIGARQIVIDGCPRTEGQVSIIHFLKDRGYRVITIWFDTPAEVCVGRLLANPRPGRPEDLSPETTARRAADYERITLPIREQVLKMSDAHLIIDNTHLTREVTRAKVLRFANEHMKDHEALAQHAAKMAPILAEYSRPRVQIVAP